MATLLQYWTDEVSRIDALIAAHQTRLITLRASVLGSEADLRTATNAVRTQYDAVASARRALSAIAMPADGDPLLADMKAALIALRVAQTTLATGELALQTLRAELAAAEQASARLATERTAAQQARDKEKIASDARKAMADKLTTGALSTLLADATAALTSHEATARSRVEDEFPGSATASKHFLKRVRARRLLVSNIAASAGEVERTVWTSNNTALAKTQRDFDAAVTTLRSTADSGSMLAAHAATLARLGALPAPNAPTTYSILSRWQHDLLHDGSKKTQRETTLAKLTEVDNARAAVIAKQEIYNKALLAAMRVDPDKSPAQLDASTVATEKGELDTKLADLQTARDTFALLPAADRQALDEWFAAVPDALWEALDQLDTAVAGLEKLKGPPTPADLITAVANAETALVTAMSAARLSERQNLAGRLATQHASAMQLAESETSLQRAAAMSRSSSLF